jgi:Fur family zinc uptake transcriptional regulator
MNQKELSQHLRQVKTLCASHAGQFLICTDCGEVNEVCNHELDESLNAVEKNQGFTLQRPVIELLGRCASCQK